MKILNINNTKVVYHYLPSKLTNIQILTNVGSAAEKESEWGYAHILEHNLFRGSKKYPNPLDIQTAANDIGGKLNAFTWIDVVNYHISVLNDFFRKGFDILADMYLNPLLPEEEFKKEISPILSEMRRYEDSPETYLYNRLMPEMIGKDAGHPIIGTETSVSSASLDSVKNFYDRFYGGDNIMISIVGGVKEHEVVSVLNELFIPMQNKEKPNIPNVIYKSGNMTLTKPGITEAVYSLIYPALPRFHSDRYKQSLMTYILGGSDSGMLFERIREELGLSCYGVFASQSHFDSHNLLEISAGIDPTQINQCHDEVLKQINKLMTEKIDEKRLERAKASLRTSIAASSENSSGYNSSIAISMLKGMVEDPLEKLLINIEKATADDILELARKTFSVEPFRGELHPET